MKKNKSFYDCETFYDYETTHTRKPNVSKIDTNIVFLENLEFHKSDESLFIQWYIKIRPPPDPEFSQKGVLFRFHAISSWLWRAIKIGVF